MSLPARRAQAIYAHLEQEDGEAPDVILFRNAAEPQLDLSFFYVTGVPGGLFEGSTTAVFPDGRVVLFTSPLEEESARHGDGYEVVVFGGEHGRQDDLLMKTIKEHLGRAPDHIGLNAREITWQNKRHLHELYPKAHLVDVSSAVKKARMVKDQAEIKALQKACDAVSKVGDMIPDLLELGITEAELAARMDYEVMRNGGDGRSFTTIVAFGPRSSEPHYHPKDKPLEKNQYVLCDFGAFADRYASDMTRTYFFGKPEDKHKRIYDTVLEAQLKGIELLKAGGRAGDVHTKVAEHIDATEFKGRFIHSTGHTIGLSVHDGGTLHPVVDMELAVGQVWTCEPGIYIPGFGGVRIEDDILITKQGPKVLTTANKEWTVVEA